MLDIDLGLGSMWYWVEDGYFVVVMLKRLVLRSTG